MGQDENRLRDPIHSLLLRVCAPSPARRDRRRPRARRRRDHESIAGGGVVSCSQSKLKHVAGRGEYGLNFPASEYVADGVRLIRTTDLANGYLSSGDSGVYVPQDAVAAQDKMACGDILLSRSGDRKSVVEGKGRRRRGA